MSELADRTEIAVGARTCPSCGEAYPGDFVVCPRDGSPLDAAGADEEADPLLGSVLGGTFRILRVVGEGATARVYEASHVRLGKKRFAVKVLHSFYAQNATAVARFQREAETAAAIDHDGIVGVYDVNRTKDGHFYIVTELLTGRDLATLLAEQPRLEPALAVRIARGVCHALEAAHAHDVVHRDLKPENVYLSGAADAPSVKLIDFGISKIKDGANLTQTGMLVGTPTYMAPEQAAGGTIDARTDVYAVGAILYEMVTGRQPFMGEETAELLSAIVSEEPPRPRSLVPTLPEALELVIQRAMTKKADDRYASAAELGQALAPFEGSRAAAAPAVPDASVRSAKSARPTLVAGTLGGFLWALFVIAAPVLALLGKGDPPDGGFQIGRLIAVTFALSIVLGGPLALFVQHARRIWQSTPRTIELSSTVRRALSGALVGYALPALALRVLETSASTQAGALADFALLVSSATGAGAGFLLRRIGR